MFPEPPPDAHHSEGRLNLRYDDITQDGHLRCVALSHVMGRGFWQASARTFLAELRGQGIVPILNRWWCEAGAGPIGLRAGVRALARYDLAHVRRGDAVDRIVLRVWATAATERDVIHGPRPQGAGEIIEAGRVYAEHVFTRLFAPKGERRVRALDVPNLPSVPPRTITRTSPEDLLALPSDAAWTSSWERDEAPIVMGLDHTDANQHVNSLVYPELFRDAALRGWRGCGQNTVVRVVTDEHLFRKPCFAGERLVVARRTFTHGDRLGAALALIGDEAMAGETTLAGEGALPDRLTGSSFRTVARLKASRSL